jgi:autotransporter adhesin
MQSQITGLGTAISGVNNRVTGVQKEARAGIAAAASIAHAPMPSAPGKTTWRVNAAGFKGYGATSLSVSHRLPTALPIAVAAAVAYAPSGGTIVSGGLQGEF